MATLTLSAKDPAAVTADALVLARRRRHAAGRGCSARSPCRRRPARALADAVPLLGGHRRAPTRSHRLPAVPGVAARCVVLTGVGEVRGARTPRGPAPRRRRRDPGAGGHREGRPRAARPPTPAAVAARRRGRAARRLRVHPVPDGVRPGRRPAAGAGGRARLRRTPRARRLGLPHARREVLAEAVERDPRPGQHRAGGPATPRRSPTSRPAAADGLPVAVTVLDEKAAGQGRLRRPPRRRARARPARRGWSGWTTPPPAPRRTSRWSARASRSTPAACRSSRPAGMEAMKSDMAGAAAVLHAVGRARPARPAGARDRLAARWPRTCRRGTAQRPSDVLTIRGGTHRRGAQHRRRGPAGARRRARRGRRGEARRDRRRRHPDRRADGRAGHAGRRRSWRNDDALRAPRCTASPTQVGEQFWPMPLPAGAARQPGLPGRRPRQHRRPVRRDARRRAVPAASSSARDGVRRRPIPWAHLDIAGPAFNAGSAYGYTPAGGTGVGVRTLVGLVEDVRSSPML